MRCSLGKITFAPDTPAVHKLVRGLNQSHATFNQARSKRAVACSLPRAQVFGGIFANEADAVNWALRDLTEDADYNSDNPYAQRTWALMVFDELDIPHGRVKYAASPWCVFLTAS